MLENLQSYIPQVSTRAIIMLNRIEKRSFVVACSAIEKVAGLITHFLKCCKKLLDLIKNNKLIESEQLDSW